MKLIEWKTSQVIAAIAGSVLMLSPALADRGGILRWVPVATGAGLLFTIPSNKHGRDEDDDLVAYIKAGWEVFSQGAVKETKEILAETAPPSINRWVDSVATSFTDPLELFRRLHEKSFLLVAETGGGKTWLMHQSVLFATETRDQFLVLDKSYGKRGDKGDTPEEKEKNRLMTTWWRLPVGKQIFLFGEDNVENLPDLLYSAYQERNRRKSAIEKAAQTGQPIPSFPCYRLYITEWNQTQASYAKLRSAAFESLDKDEEPPALPSPETLDFWKDELLFDGHGYNMFLGLDVQSAAVGRTNIDKSQQSQVNWLLMGSTAINITEVGKLITNPKDWVSRVQAARSLPGMQRAGIAIIDGKPYLYNPVPYGDGLVVPQVQDARSDVEQWLDLRKPDIVTWISDQPMASPSSSFDQRFKVEFPQGFRDRKATNPYWVAFKDFFQTVKGAS
jgi:hypothetical protein